MVLMLIFFFSTQIKTQLKRKAYDEAGLSPKQEESKVTSPKKVTITQPKQTTHPSTKKVKTG